MRPGGHSEAPNPSGDGEMEKASTAEASDVAAPSDDKADGERYRLLSIDAVRTPKGCTGSDWYAYRIAQGDNGITGYRRGNLARVTVEVESIVTALNARRQWAKEKPSTKRRRLAPPAARRAACT